MKVRFGSHLFILVIMFKFWARRKCGDNVVLSNPYSHPLHMKVMKHVSFVRYGFRNHTRLVYSLNPYSTKVSFGVGAQ
jgi:hypothetical protein